MNPAVKNFLIIAAKNAVNAVLTNAGLMAMFSQTFNLHDWNGVLSLLKATAVVVLSREATVWGPKIISWSTSGQDSKA